MVVIMLDQYYIDIYVHLELNEENGRGNFSFLSNTTTFTEM